MAEFKILDIDKYPKNKKSILDIKIKQIINYFKIKEDFTMKLKEEEIEALAVLDTKLELYGEGEPEFTYNQLDNLSKLIERLLDENEKLSKEV